MTDPITGALGAAGAKAAGGVLVKVVIGRAAPVGFAWAKTWLKGRKVVIVGPGGAGKSTFLNYFAHDVFQHEQEYVPTDDPKDRSRFELKVGQTQTLSVAIKTIVDIPGQLDASEFVYGQRPHALIIVLDVGSVEAQAASADWLLDFFRRLNDRWGNDSKRRNRLRSAIVVMNKVDKLVDPNKIEVEAKLRTLTKEHFKIAGSAGVKTVRFKPCSVVENPLGTKLVDAIIVDVALSLKGAQ